MKHAKCPVFSLLRGLLVWLSLRLVLQATFNRESRPVNKNLLPKSYFKSLFLWPRSGRPLEVPDCSWNKMPVSSPCRFLSLLRGGMWLLKPVLFLFRGARGFGESKTVPQTSPLILRFTTPVPFRRRFVRAHAACLAPSRGRPGSGRARHIILITEPSLSALTHF